MRHGTVSVQESKVDWKGLGYLVSILSVILLGIVAWPKDGEPRWYLPLLITGMATSILGMGFRYKAHIDQKREIRRAEAKADGRSPAKVRDPVLTEH